MKSFPEGRTDFKKGWYPPKQEQSISTIVLNFRNQNKALSVLRDF
jgi:hypothetical protein